MPIAMNMARCATVWDWTRLPRSPSLHSPKPCEAAPGLIRERRSAAGHGLQSWLLLPWKPGRLQTVHTRGTRDSAVCHGLGLSGCHAARVSTVPSRGSGTGPGRQIARATACNRGCSRTKYDCRPCHTRNRTAAERGGYTLVEVLVVVAITSMILTSVGVTLSTLFRFEGQLRSGAAEQAMLGRLTLQLRGDRTRLRRSSRCRATRQVRDLSCTCRTIRMPSTARRRVECAARFDVAIKGYITSCFGCPAAGNSVARSDARPILRPSPC